MSNVCAICGKPIADEDLVTQVVQECRQTHWSPAEYVDVVLHQACLEREQWLEDNADYERAAARYDGEGKDWR